MRRSQRAAVVAAVLLLAGPALAQTGPKVANAEAGAGTAQVQPAPAALPSDPLAAAIARRLAEPATGKDRDERKQTADFYAARGHAPVWIEDGVFGARARAAMDEIRRADDWGLKASDYTLPAQPATATPDLLAAAELQLTRAVLAYASHARGGRMNPNDLTFSFDRQPPLLAPSAVLAGISQAGAADAYLRGLHPKHPQFEKLRQLHLALKAGTYVDPDAVREAAAEPEAAPAGKGRDGKQAKAKAKTKTARRTVSAERVLYNMEMWRWMPEDLGRFHIVDNIPEFTMRVVRDGRVIHAERIIVGKVQNQTPAFSMGMKTVVLQPDWNVPNSIKVKELLPGLMRGSDSFARNGLKATYRGREVSPGSLDWSRVDIRNLHVVQPPGPSNVLGVVKFLFPNKHDVYMHDTPTKNLFNADVRTFSHGCVRVRNPVRLAEIVLGEDKGMSAEQVADLIRRGPANNHIQLSTPIPVHLTYFTVVVGEDGKPQVFNDVYGHEKLIQLGLDGKAHTIVKKKESLSDVVAQLAETRRNYRPPQASWWGSDDEDEEDARPRNRGGSGFGSSNRGGGGYQPYRGGGSGGNNDFFRSVFGG